MNQGQIREQIKIILSGVSGVGIVHDYDRWTKDRTKLISLFKTADDRLSTVMFRRINMAKKTITIGAEQGTHTRLPHQGNRGAAGRTGNGDHF